MDSKQHEARQVQQHVRARWLCLIQFRALAEKEWLMRQRKLKLHGLLLFCSCLCVFFVWSFERAIIIYQQLNSGQGSQAARMLSLGSSIPNCEENIFIRKDRRCFSLLYAPDTEEFSDVVRGMCQDNQPVLDQRLVKGFASGSLMDEYLYDHPNTVIAAVEFFKESSTKYAFSVQTNGTVRWFKGKFQEPHTYAQIPVILAVQKALAVKISGQNLGWKVSAGQFPQPHSDTKLNANLAPLFYISSMLLILVLQVHDIVDQREKGTVSLLTLAGLRDIPYWFSLIATYSSIYMVNAIVLSLASLMFLFPTFMGLGFLYSFVLLANTSQAMMALGLFMSSLVRKASSTISVGFACFFFAWTVMAILSFGFPYSFSGNTAWKVLFGIFPWTILYRGYEIILSTDNQLRLLAFNGLLTIQTCMYTIFAFYFKGCLPDNEGKVTFPWYLVDFRRLYPKEFITRKIVQALARKDSTGEEDDANIQSQESEMRAFSKAYISNSLPEQGKLDYAIQMHGLRKEYRVSNYMPWLRSKKTIALEGNWFGVKKGECFCLLGPNSAGKTTTIKCLLGLTQQSEGQAIIEGHNVCLPQEYRQAHSQIGYCPQNDQALVDLLTFTEHYELICAMKGVTPTTDEIDQINKITSCPHKLIRDATTTERKKLSIAIALAGNPQILILDEPTALLDPSAKRTVVKYIESLRGGRSILLATHSMDEAELISDRIGIMVRGKLRCLGTPLELKSRFGSGYRLSVGIKKDRTLGDRKSVERTLVDLMRKGLDVKTVNTSADYIEFTLPYAKEDRLPLMLTHLNNNKDMLSINDIQLRPTPLEDVFMTITKKAELEKAEIEGRFETLILAEEKIALKIPVGADYIESPGGNFYMIKWTKDRSGQLKIYDYSPDRVADSR